MHRGQPEVSLDVEASLRSRSPGVSLEGSLRSPGGQPALVPAACWVREGGERVHFRNGKKQQPTQNTLSPPSRTQHAAGTRGCCFFPLRKCIFSVAETFWVAKLDFLCCWFFSCLGRFFSCLGRVFSRLGRFFPAASKMHFFCCKGAFVLLQGVFSAALNFSRCEAAFFAGIFSRCGNSFFPLQGVFFLLPNVFFSVPMFFPAANLCFSRAARRQGARERRVIHWAFATCKLDSAWTNR